MNATQKRDIDYQVLPHDTICEEAVLGGMLIQSQFIDSIIAFLYGYEDFYSLEHQIIYKHICKIHQQGDKVDLVTVNASIKTSNEIEKPAYLLGQLASRVSSSENILTHAAIIRQHAIRRGMIQYFSKPILSDSDPFDELDKAIQYLEGLKAIKGEINRLLNESAKEVHTNLRTVAQNEYNEDNPITGINTGFHKLNIETGGWQKTDLVIVAARPGMGKSAFMLSSAMLAGTPIGIFSLEMGYEQLATRVLSMLSGIDNGKFKGAKFQPNEWNYIIDTTKQLDEKPVCVVDDTPGIQITDLKAKARIWKRKFKIEVLFVDYLQLIKSKGHGSRELEIAYITRELKNLAKELKITVVCLAQLSRAVELRGDRRPILSDLRESGEIEQAADLVLFLMRPDIYFPGKTIRVNGYEVSNSGLAHLDIGKNRHGGLKEITLRYEGILTLFTDY